MWGQTAHGEQVKERRQKVKQDIKELVGRRVGVGEGRAEQTSLLQQAADYC